MSDPIYYLHIPKTAGTSVISYLDEQFAQERICPAQLLPELFKLEKNRLLNYHLFRGHLWAGVDQYTGLKLNYITMLRDPLQRTISWYSHVKRDPHAYRHDQMLAEDWSLLQFVTDSETQWDIVNAQTIFLAADLDYNKLSKDPVGYGTAVIREYASRKTDRTLLDLAKSRLEKFVFVGIVERMNHSLQLMSHTLGFHPHFSDQKLNVSSGGPRSSELSTDVINAIAEITYLDRELYSWASAAFEAHYDKFVNSLLVDAYYADPLHSKSSQNAPLLLKDRKKLSIQTILAPARSHQGSLFQVHVKIVNNSSFIIESYGHYPIFISYHWLDKSNNAHLVFEGIRTEVEPKLLTNQTAIISANVVAPKSVALCTLRMTFVQEAVAWFDEPDCAVFSETEILVE
ncbi:sulfotransferase family protein [Pseudomonas sp. KU26590]|uniref:sulfotransferase family 2 domain-containing protein n=1 Tax=Pseudomonas sp. KU26590 TaxID=2991051 RepID=UPI00223DC847|nr:sulfotransferase family 2 domain-containing protein [Pseudomonas sp. KU26590]UZJ61123.1 sulfotransferase family protein [Pseudomonas sp. KU26590]